MLLVALLRVALDGSATLPVALPPWALVLTAGLALLALVWPDRSGRWAAGAAGERATAVALRGIESEGFVAWHDVRLRGRRWNFDHVLVGPPGIVIVETKQWARAVRVARTHHPAVLRNVAWQVDALDKALGTHPPIHQFLCVHGARVRRRWWARRAPVGNGAHLRRWLRGLRPVLGRAEVEALSRQLRDTFASGPRGERVGYARTTRWEDRALVERSDQR